MGKTDEKPILFSAPMVRAIRAGVKTQTRRAVIVPWWGGRKCPPYEPYWVIEDGKLFGADEYGDWHEQPSPYGTPGTHLWVRETWAVGVEWDDCAPRYIDPLCGGADIWYLADGPKPDGYGKTRPGIHMPRWASRDTLEVTGVHVERLQEISEEDAKAEGSFLCRCSCAEMQRRPRTPIEASFRQTHCHVHGTEFRELWDSINGKRTGCSWAQNPWVWVIEWPQPKREGD